MNWDIDFIEELRLRRWARENYLPPNQRQRTLHPVVLDEMTKKDSEQNTSVYGTLAASVV